MIDGRQTCLLVLAVVLCFGCATMPPKDGHSVGQADCPEPVRLPPTSAELTTYSPGGAETHLVAYHQDPTPVVSDALSEGPTPLEQLVDYAVANNPEIAAARSRAQALLWRVPQAQSLDDPMLSATVFLESIQTAAGPQDFMLSVSQKFPWFGKLTARGEIAHHGAQVAFAELANVELGVVEQVKLAYYELYFVDQAIAIYRQLEPRIQDVIQSTQSRYDATDPKVGMETVLQAQVTLHKLQITLAELEQARLKAVARLAKALHVQEGMRLAIQPQLDQTTLPQQVESLVAMIEYCHPQLEAHREAIVRDDWSIDLANRNYWPDVNFGFNWNAMGSSGLSPVANGDDAFSLMVGVNLPIYKAKRDAAVQESHHRAWQSSQQYDATRDTLRAQVEQLYAQAVEHDRVLQILNDEIIRKAEQAFDISIEAYRMNRIGFQQLIDNYENLLRFQVDRYLRTTRREQAIAQLERAVGCAVAEWNANGPDGQP
ncbi:MAG: TolC family protein [Planctomycetes bacterium]|nr:TolC family protein [Planctomycetota bacterium]MBL7042013.1 TolC family protein [Pirellulaceae bacterium]